MSKICLNSKRVKLFGLDINKCGSPEGNIPIPEPLGLIPALIFIALNTIMIVYIKLYLENFVLSQISALYSIFCIIFMGFCDDVFDIRWRIKIWIPILAAIPLLIVYDGPTHIVMPLPIRHILKWKILELGYLYYFYMIIITIFCTHSINIYAGINGLEIT